MDNFQKERKSILRVQSKLCDRQTVTELSTDFTLPDYQPEIKRLLRVRATVSPPDKYVGAGNVELSGRIDYALLYAGNDGALYCATESSDYQFSVPVELSSSIDLNDGLICDVSIRTDSVTGRVAAPRKLSVKCRLRSEVRLWGTLVLEESVCGAEEQSVERLCGSADVAGVFVGVGEAMQLGDEILYDSAVGDLRVISAEGQVFVTEAMAGSGTVSCRGEIALKLLCTEENASTPPNVLWRRIPFSQSVPTDGAEVNCDACAHGVCTQLAITVEENRILCEVTLQLYTHAQRNQSVTFTKDLYSTQAECESHYETCVLPRALKCINGNFSLNTTLPLEQVGIRPDAKIADLSLLPSVTSLENEHGKYYLSGHCRASLILFDGEDYTVQEFEVPFRYETDAPAEEVCEFDAVADVISCRARIDGERIGVDAELAVCLSTRGEYRLQTLTEARFTALPAHTGAHFTVCYPSREDTLWSVAKRYHRSVSVIAEQNELAGAPAADARESLAGVTYLLV